MTSITIRDVPDEVRDEPAGRTARAGRSLQEYLRIELIEFGRRLTVQDVVDRAHSHKRVTGTALFAE